MRCYKCGHELDAEGRCSYCGMAEEPKVHVMSDDEKTQYDGITIDETSGKAEETVRPQDYRPWEGGSGIFMKHIHWSGLGGNWVMKLALLVLVAAVAAFVVFIALPVALIGIAIGAVVWILLSFLRR